MKKVKLVLIGLLSLLLLLFVLQNTATVEARFLWFEAEAPIIVLLFLTAAVGFVLGLLVPLLLRDKASASRG